MKNHFLLFLSFLSILAFSCKQPYSGLQPDNLHGNVKFLTEKKFKAEKQSDKWVATDKMEFPPKATGLYDKNNSCTEWKMYQSDTSVLNFTVLSYDEKGFLTNLITHDDAGNPNTHLEIKDRDERGQVTKATYVGKDGNDVSFVTIERDGAMIKKMTTSYPGNDVEFSQSFKYDDEGNVIEMNINQAGNGQTYASTYTVEYLEFDQYKNWVRKLEVDENTGNGAVTMREIVYR